MTSEVLPSPCHCAYASSFVNGPFETVLPPVLPTGAAKTSTQRLQTKARCPFDEGVGEPSLKRRRTGDVVQSTVPENKRSSVIRRLPESEVVRPASAKSSKRRVGAASGATKTDRRKRLEAIEKELAEMSDRDQEFKDRLAKYEARVDETGALVAEHEAQVAVFSAQVDVVLAEHARDLEGVQAQAQAIQAQVQDNLASQDRIVAEIAEFQAQLAEAWQLVEEVQAGAAQQRPFAEHAARCQVQALLDCYKSLYFKEADAFRRTNGQPKGCTDAKQSLVDFMLRALPEEEAHMMRKGFTEAATAAAREEVGSFHDDYSPYIHELDLDLIKRFFPLLKPRGSPGWDQALVVVAKAQNKCSSPSGTK